VSATAPQAGGKLAANLLTFAGLLRRTGLPVGPADVLAALAAMERVSLASRLQVHTALRATLIHRREHQDLFDQAFRLFWRDPEAGRAMAALGLFEAGKEKPSNARRPAAAAWPRRWRAERPQTRAETRDEIDAVMTVSDRERLQPWISRR